MLALVARWQWAKRIIKLFYVAMQQGGFKVFQGIF